MCYPPSNDISMESISENDEIFYNSKCTFESICVTNEELKLTDNLEKRLVIH